MACPDEQIGVAPHEVLSHADLNPVGQQAVGMSLESLDVAEDVIPSAAVQSDGVIPQFIQNLIHLKHCWKCFNQRCSSDAPFLNSNHFLCSFEHTIPYPSFPIQIQCTCCWKINILGNTYVDIILLTT